MNAEKKKAELKTNDFNKEVEVKDGNATKTYRVKIDKGEDAKFNDQDEFSCKQKITIKAKVVEKTDANKTKLEEIDKQPKSDIEVALDKTTWSRCLRIIKVDGKDVIEPEKKTEVSVKGNMFIWPTWTLIIGGSIVGLAITAGLIWALLKKDSDEE